MIPSWRSEWAGGELEFYWTGNPAFSPLCMIRFHLEPALKQVSPSLRLPGTNFTTPIKRGGKAFSVWKCFFLSRWWQTRKSLGGGPLMWEWVPCFLLEQKTSFFSALACSGSGPGCTWPGALSLKGIVTNGWSNGTPANAFADVIGQIGPKCFESDSDLSQAISRSLKRVAVVGKLIGGYLGSSLCGLCKF